MEILEQFRPSALPRVLAVWLVEILGLRLLDLVLPGLQVGGTLAAAGAVAALGLLNALVWPGLMRFTLRLTVLSAGGLTLLLNAATVWLASLMVPEFQVDGLGTAMLTSLGLTAVNGFFSSLVHLGREHSYYRNVVLRRMKKESLTSACDTAGICFVEIDGLSRRVLEKAVQGGWMPTVARWLTSGSHRLHGWECDLSSQTAASQAGILHGHNDGIVAFRWYEKESGKLVRASSPAQIQAIEARLSDGRGLLSRGASRANMLSGDAPDSILTSSTILDRGRHRTESYYAFFADPYNFNRTLLLFLWEVLVEVKDALVQKVRGESPRIRRAGAYPFMRAGMTVLLREVTTHVVIGDLFAGVPAVYSTYSGYDEVAHHAGVARKETMKVLRQIDGQLARLEAAAKAAPRPYHLILLSDHGQSQGPTFRQRYGTTLQDEVRRLVSEQGRVLGATTANEGWGHLKSE